MKSKTLILIAKGVTKITVKFVTLGCKTNIYESEAMAELFKERGYEIIRDGVADICVINTCSVTGTGAKKSRQQIRRARHENPNGIIAVTGCFSQTEPEVVRELGADIIIGNSGRSKIVELTEQAIGGKKSNIVGDILGEHEYEELPITKSQSRIRAGVKIEDGCNNFCTYCIIPYARGPVRSRPLENIVRETESLAEHGYKEVVLTGIHIGSYGRDINPEKIGLIDVIEKINEINGIERIRLGSIEPVLITDDFVHRAAALQKLCPQFHLSLQSGCDETLKRMNRHYTSGEFFKAVQLLRDNIKDTAITTDLMVGFAEETDEEFDKSYAFCKSIGFSQMHIFKYSIRKGTRAETFPNQVPENIKDERSRKMLTLAEDMKRSYYESYIGKELRVLIEQERTDGLYHATTANYMDVLVPADESKHGKFITFTPKEYKDGFLI